MINIAGHNTQPYMTTIPLPGQEKLNTYSEDFTQNANSIVRRSS